MKSENLLSPYSKAATEAGPPTELKRPIDLRYRPPVAKLDLEQGLNFIDMDAAGKEFCYQHYTSLLSPYREGSRPVLEGIAFPLRDPNLSRLQQIQRLNDWIVEHFPHAEIYLARFGKALAADRGLSDEELIQTGYGWCNEQARVICGLSQVLGIPSRLVFGRDHNKNGHVMSEMFTGEGWVLVDQTINFLFVRDGRPLSAAEALYEKDHLAYFSPIHKEQKLKVLGKEIGFGSGDPAFLPGCSVGFHNHYVY